MYYDKKMNVNYSSENNIKSSNYIAIQNYFSITINNSDSKKK